MFGPYSMNKALCSCGELVDVDSEVLRRKVGLGKRVECRECRNRRIAIEHDALEMHYLGIEGEEPW